MLQSVIHIFALQFRKYAAQTLAVMGYYDKVTINTLCFV